MRFAEVTAVGLAALKPFAVPRNWLVCTSSADAR